MEKLYIDETVLQELFSDRAATAEFTEFLNSVIDEELSKEDEADCDLIDACIDALEELQTEDGVSYPALTALLSQEKFLKSIQKRSVARRGVYKKLSVICASLVLLFAAGSVYTEQTTGQSMVRQIGNKLAAIFTAGEVETTLPEETTAPIPEPTTETTEPETSASEPETTTRPRVKTQKAVTTERIYGVLPDDLKTTYKVGESLDTTGLRVMAVRSDGTETEIPLSDCAVSVDKAFSRDPGKYTVTVSYQGLSFGYGVTVYAQKDTAVLNSVYGAFPAGYDFTVASFDDLDLSCMTVAAVYSDGSERTLTPEEYTVTVERNFMDLENKALVTVTYQDRAFSFILTQEAQ